MQGLVLHRGPHYRDPYCKAFRQVNAYRASLSVVADQRCDLNPIQSCEDLAALFFFQSQSLKVQVSENYVQRVWVTVVQLLDR